VRSALDAAFMVCAGTDPAEAVALAGTDAHDQRVKQAAMRGTALIAHVKAGGTQAPLTTMRHVRDGDTIRLNDGTVVKVAAIERGTVAYIYTGHGPEFHTALDAPVTILHRNSTGEGTAEQRDIYADAEYAAEKADDHDPMERAR
jgi:hypothetical protein